MKRICLWSSPRNISTALMYSFAQRADTLVIDEPLYAHYLYRSNLNHPGRNEILASMENDGELVVKNVILGSYDKKIIFMKQMAHHLIDLEESFLFKVENIILIRDPRKILNSFSKIIPDVTMNDIGIEKQYKLFLKLIAEGHFPVIIDSGEILKDPLSALSKLCMALNIPFYEEMLKWEKGPRPEDGVWAKYWYSNVHNSTGLSPGRVSGARRA